MKEPQRFEQSGEFVLVERIAAAIRAELGTATEVCPGHRAPEQAEPLNRAFRAVARCVLEPVAMSQGELSRLVSHILRRIVVRRLEAGGLGKRAIQTLLEFEPGTPDDWLTFLILVPWAEVLFWLTYDDPEPA
jgi:hypothetical protein